MLYKNDGTKTEERLSEKASSSLKESCSEVAGTLKDALGNTSLQKTKDKNEILLATKQFIHYLKAREEGVLTDTEICALQGALKTAGENCTSTGTKQLCSQLSDAMSSLARQEQAKDTKPTKRSKTPKTPKSQKKPKTPKSQKKQTKTKK